MRGLQFYYGASLALKSVTMPLYERKVTAFIGPSGCGKSTLLRVLNRMYDLYPDQRAEGEVLLDGENILAPGLDLNLLRARVGMVFQKPTPFPMSIYDNIAFGIRLYEKLPKSEMDGRVESALRRSALWSEVKDKLNASGLSLSGGQQQRLCIARTVAISPEVILFDEPCSALDPISTAKIEELIDELARRIHDRHRHPQHAAGGARLAVHRLHVPRRDGRIRRDRARCSPRRATSAPRTTSPAGSAEGVGAVVDHTVKAYDKDLDALERRIAEMGGIAEKMVIDAMDALSQADVALANQVVATDPRLDALQREIEEQAILTIARRQPMAVDLREIIGAIRVAGDLERVGDLAKNIAKRSLKIGIEARVPRAIVGLRHMNDVATELMKDVLDAYAQRDTERARAVWERDAETRRARGFGVPRPPDPHDGGSAQHLVLRPPAVLLEEHRADRRPRHQHRRDGVLSRHRRDPAGRASEGPARIRHSDARNPDPMNEARREPSRAVAAAPRILVVEDESDLALLLTYNLEAEGYVAEAVERGDEAELRLVESPPDLVILDWMLPGVSGLEICRRLRAREATKTLPVIMLTARGEEVERVRGLSVGADDYVVKPFSLPELMARVRALLRRSRPERIAEKLSAGDLDLDRETRRVRRGSRDIHLGPTEFRLLEYLLERPGRVFSRAQLLDGVWGQSVEIDERTVDVHVGRLRKALSRGRERDPIRTVRGTGYSFDETYGKS